MEEEEKEQESFKSSEIDFKLCKETGGKIQDEVKSLSKKHMIDEIEDSIIKIRASIIEP